MAKKKNLNIFLFLTAFLISLPFWWGVNFLQEKLESFLFLESTAIDPELLTAQIALEEKLEKLKPLKKRGEIADFKSEARAAISVFFDYQGSEKILFEKNISQPLPIASLTKLMTANIFLKHYDFGEEEVVNLLLSLLIESNNKAANDLAGINGKEIFLELMNSEAKELGMENTYFANPSGLDPKEPGELLNYSTAKDLVKLAKYLTFERPLIWEISIIPEFENNFNTNKLLEEIPGIIGGKTGETSLAGKCLILVVRAPKNKGFIVNVILNSENSFEEMKKLIDWTEYAFQW